MSISNTLSRWAPQKGSFRFDVGVLAAGAAFQQALLVIVSPLLTRLYTAEDFGRLQVYLSLSVFLIGIASLRYEMAVLIPKDPEMAVNVLAVALAAVFVLALLCALVIVVLLGTCDIGSSDVRFCVAALSIGMYAAATYQVLVSWCVRQNRFQQIAKTKSHQIIVMLTVQVVLGVTGCGVVGLVIGDVLGKATGIIQLVRSARREDGTLLSHITAAEMARAACKYSAFPRVAIWSVLINTAGTAVPMLLITAWYGPAVAGSLALAERVTVMPAALVGYAVAHVYNARLAQYAHSSPSRVPVLFAKTASMLSLVGLPLAIVFGWAGPSVFVLAFGNNWEPAGHYARVLALSSVVGLVAGGLTQTLNILEKQSLQLLWDIVRAALAAAAMCSVFVTGCSAGTAILAYAASSLIAYTMLIVMYYDACRSHAAVDASNNAKSTNATAFAGR